MSKGTSKEAQTKETLAIKIPKKLKKAIAAFSAKENRSITQQMVHIIQKFFGEEEKKNEQAKL